MSLWQSFTNGFFEGMFYNMLGFFSPFGGGCGGGWGGMCNSIFCAPGMNMGGYYPYSDVTMQMPTPSEMMYTAGNAFNYSSYDYSSTMPMGMNMGMGMISGGVAPMFGLQSPYFTAPATPKPKPTPKEKPDDIIPTADAKTLHNKWKGKSKGRISDEFCQRVIDIANKINCDPDDLMTVIYNESGFDHTVVNECNMVGLIQLSEGSRSTIEVPGNTDAERKQTLINMTAVEQLDWVEKWLLKSIHHLEKGPNERITLGDLGALLLLPGYCTRENVIDKDDPDTGKYYTKWNKPLDTDGDGIITKKEITDRLIKKKGG